MSDDSEKRFVYPYRRRSIRHSRPKDECPHCSKYEYVTVENSYLAESYFIVLLRYLITREWERESGGVKTWQECQNCGYQEGKE